MRARLLAEIRANGVITRPRALEVVPRHVLNDASQDQVISRLLPGVYSLPEWAGQPRIRRLAALAYRPDGALSHVDSLDEWELPGLVVPPSATTHLTVDASSSRVGPAGVELHRRSVFCESDVRRRNGLRVLTLERSIVDSWSLLPAIDQRLPTILALRERRTSSERLCRALDRTPRTAGAAMMRRLFYLVGSGLHSELELWGHEGVSTTRGCLGWRCNAS